MSFYFGLILLISLVNQIVLNPVFPSEYSVLRDTFSNIQPNLSSSTKASHSEILNSVVASVINETTVEESSVSTTTVAPSKDTKINDEPTAEYEIILCFKV